MKPAALKNHLVETAAERYLSASRFAYHFAKGKLGTDPVFTAILAQGLIPDGARILDLGCGQGLLAAWLLAAGACEDNRRWCADWPPPPRNWIFRGIELLPRDVDRGRKALGPSACLERGDIRSTPFGENEVVVILDVLHYMDMDNQKRVLRKVRESLNAGGMLILRVGDAAAGLPFKFSNWVDQCVLLIRGHGLVRLFCRSVADWIELLRGIGFETQAVPMSAGTPFANVLLIAAAR